MRFDVCDDVIKLLTSELTLHIQGETLWLETDVESTEIAAVTINLKTLPGLSLMSRTLRVGNQRARAGDEEEEPSRRIDLSRRANYKKST